MASSITTAATACRMSLSITSRKTGKGGYGLASNGGGVARLVEHPQENGGAKFVSFKLRETIDPPVRHANNVRS